MHAQPLPLTRDLVLIGGGHSHALVLRKWAMAPLAGVRVTLINPDPTAPYSGMLPGHVAGHYARADLEIDLVRLARFAGARLVLAPARGLDPEARLVEVEGRPPVAYDVASVNVGITTAMPALPGFAEHAVPAKPLGTFAAAWAVYLGGTGAASVAMIGGGVAGVELAMAMAHALGAAGRVAEVHLVERERVLSTLPAPAARRLRAALAACGVIVHEKTGIAAVDAEGLVLEGGGRIAAGFVTGAAGALPPAWLAKTGLALHEGFVRVDARLQTSSPGVFAAGDCVHLDHAPRPKAGVYAVREAPILLDNLRATLAGSDRLRRYRPQRDFLKLITLGRRSALADRFGLTVAGPAIWRWKDRIDRRFMTRFHDLPPMPAPDLPSPHAAGLREALGPKPLCGGCGAKLGRDALLRALGAADAPGDDAAILTTGGATQVISTDHLRAMVEDPFTMARIAAVHALGDIWAMGARPQAALLSVVVPRQTDALAGRALAEIVAGVREVLAAAGAELVGGHSSLGAETTIGLTVTGLCEGAPLTLAGARPGDALILTRALGSGVIMAAEMERKADGTVVAAALRAMQQPQGAAAGILRGAHAMTDVTGFGLAGHLLNLCARSGTGAEIALAEVPLLDGAEALAASGVQSSLAPANRALLPGAPAGPRADLLFDPQTGGGLLAAVPGDPAPLVAALRETGYDAAAIGRITDRAGQVAIV